MAEHQVGDIVYVIDCDPDSGEEVEIRMRVVKVTEFMVKMVAEPAHEPEGGESDDDSTC